MNKLPGFLLAALCGSMLAQPAGAAPRAAIAPGANYPALDRDRSYYQYHREGIRGARPMCPPGLLKPYRGCLPPGRLHQWSWRHREDFAQGDWRRQDRFGHDWLRPERKPG